MPVSNLHPLYERRLPEWQKNRTFCRGQTAVKDAGDLYLPRKGGETDADYSERLEATLFFNGAGRTVEGYLGAIYRKPPVIKVVPSNQEYLKDMTGTGRSAQDTATFITNDLMEVGKGGILIEMETEEKAEKDKENRAYMTFYMVERIRNWKTRRVNGEKQTTLVVLEEDIPNPSPADEYDQSFITQLRVLKLENGVYIQELWHSRVKKEEETRNDNRKKIEDPSSEFYEKVSTITPKRRGTPLNKIPFIPYSTKGIGWDDVKSPVEDIVAVNHSHYITTSQHENVLRFVGSPMACFWGVDAKSEILLGSTRAFTSEETEGHAEFLELEGKSVEHLEKAMEAKEKKMAVLGARLLEEQKAAAEAAETVRIRQSGEGGVIGRVAKVTGVILEEAISWLLWWQTNEDDPAVEITMNTDFIAGQMDAQTVTALMQAWLNGGMSKETFIYNLQRGEFMPDGRTVEEEITAIENQAPELTIDPAPDPDNPDDPAV